jgi:hypothetical protein
MVDTRDPETGGGNEEGGAGQIGSRQMRDSAIRIGRDALCIGPLPHQNLTGNLGQINQTATTSP